MLWRAVCLFKGHRPKFGTNPVRGICIRCGKWPKGVDRWEWWRW
jgi:hypothetical protein